MTLSKELLYVYRPSDELAAKLQTSQLNMVEIEGQHAEDYLMDPFFIEEVALTHLPIEGFVPLNVAPCFFDVIDNKRYFYVYQSVGDPLTIAPVKRVNLTDTQFSDVTEDPSMGRTLLGTLFDAFENTDQIPDIAHENAFRIINNVFVFPMGVQIKKQPDEKIPGEASKFRIINYGASIGRVTADEIVDDAETYDELTVKVAEYIILLDKGLAK